jgi:starch synthase
MASRKKQRRLERLQAQKNSDVSAMIPAVPGGAPAPVMKPPGSAEISGPRLEKPPARQVPEAAAPEPVSAELTPPVERVVDRPPHTSEPGVTADNPEPPVQPQSDPSTAESGRQTVAEPAGHEPPVRKQSPRPPRPKKQVVPEVEVSAPAEHAHVGEVPAPEPPAPVEGAREEQSASEQREEALSSDIDNPEEADFGTPAETPIITDDEAPVDPDNLPAVEVKREPGMRILLIASEFSPLINAGGLGDAVAGLAAALVKLGHEVRVVIPKYSGINYPMEWYHGPMGVWIGNSQQWSIVCKATGPGNVPVFLIEYKEYFERWGLYHAANMDDYKDNPVRFAYLCRAAFQFCIDHNWSPDIVHVHDWQTALGAAYLKDWYWNNPVLGRSASVLTIHNIAYQGKYPGHWYGGFGINGGYYRGDVFEDHGMVNMLKGGIAFADMITTVSPTHGREISGPGGGWGLAPYLSNKGDRFRGIVNGIDYAVWSPENDPTIPQRYTAVSMQGKKECKRRLQEEFRLHWDENICLIGAIGRFVDQKGYHLLQQEIEPILNSMHVQFVMLGSGKDQLQGYFRWLPGKYPGKVGSFIGFNNWLAHLITAGCDLFVMPSIYEPCGLNQMYAQRYGTLPVVHATGGLEDTVENYNPNNGDGTGFKFWDTSRAALYHTMGWAVQTYYDRRDHFLKMRYNAMCRDFSWENSARQYIDAYKRAIQHKQWYDSQFR